MIQTVPADQRAAGRGGDVAHQQVAQPDRRQRHHGEQRGDQQEEACRGGEGRGLAHRVRDVGLRVVQQTPVQDQVEAAAQVLGVHHVQHVDHGQRREADPERRRGHQPGAAGQRQQDRRRDDRLAGQPDELVGPQQVQLVGHHHGPENEREGQRGRRPPHHARGPRIPAPPGPPVRDTVPEGAGLRGPALRLLGLLRLRDRLGVVGARGRAVVAGVGQITRPCEDRHPRGPSVRSRVDRRIRWWGRIRHRFVRRAPARCSTAAPRGRQTPGKRSAKQVVQASSYAPPTAVSSANGAAAERDSRTQA